VKISPKNSPSTHPQACRRSSKDVSTGKDIDVTALRLAAAAAATAVAAVGMAAAAHADADYQQFQSPSGDVKCELTVNYMGEPYANCTVRNASYAVPPDQCDMSRPVFPQFGITQGHTPAQPSCVIDHAELPWPTLDFGQKRSVGTITCDSEPAGVTCTDAGTGHFIRVSPESYDLG
jgi:hypothetical protein